jgi:hypothetical protein
VRDPRSAYARTRSPLVRRWVIFALGVAVAVFALTFGAPASYAADDRQAPPARIADLDGVVERAIVPSGTQVENLRGLRERAARVDPCLDRTRPSHPRLAEALPRASCARGSRASPTRARSFLMVYLN